MLSNLYSIIKHLGRTDFQSNTFSKKLLNTLTNIIRETLDSQALLYSLKVAAITLLLKPGKYQQKCGSYRPFSLLNSDYKVLSKLIAL